MSATIPYPVRPGASQGRPRLRLVTVRLVRESGFAAPENYPSGDAPIQCPADVFARMEPYAEREVGEAFWILPLDNQSRVCAPGLVVITRGLLNSSMVHPREVFHAAIEAHAAGMILVHNHPSGDPTPSAEDRSVTRQLLEVGRIHDIPVYDHVVVGRGRYVSFAEAGSCEPRRRRARIGAGRCVVGVQARGEGPPRRHRGPWKEGPPMRAIEP